MGMKCSVAGFVLASVSAALEIGSGTYAQFRAFPLKTQFFFASIGGGSSLRVLGSSVTGLFGIGKNTPTSMESASPFHRSAAHG